MSRPRIGVGCPIPSERATFIEWLDASGYEPVPMIDLSAIETGSDGRPMEALIADVGLVPPERLPLVLKRLGSNRPLILVGPPDQAPDCVMRDVSWIDRPVAYEGLVLQVALALAEGRPARRSPRKLVTPLGSTVDGVNAQVMDVSPEGVRLELHGVQAGALPPIFTMRVPAFGVVTTVKRVWVTQPSPGSIWCGGSVVRNSPKSAHAWRTLVDNAPSARSAVHLKDE